MSKTKENRQPLSLKLDNLSPENFGSLAFKQLSISPQKLTQNFLFKQAATQKKLQAQKKKVRQLQTTNSMLSQKHSQLEVEFDTVRKSLLLQIEMYKQMLREQQDEKTRHIKSLQSAFNTEIQRLLNEQDDDAKVVQAQKEELEGRVKTFKEKVDELEKKLGHAAMQTEKMEEHLENTRATLKNVEDRLANQEMIAKSTKEKLEKEVHLLKDNLQKQQSLHTEMVQELSKQRLRQLEQIKKNHHNQIRKIEQRFQTEMNNKTNESKNLLKVFQQEGKRMQQIINNKDMQVANRSLEATKEKQAALSANRQLNQILRQNQTLLEEIKQCNRQKQQLLQKIKGIQIEVSAINSKHEMVVTGLKSQLAKQNVQFIRENDRLVRENQRLKKQNNQNQKEIVQIRNQSRQLSTQIQADNNKITAVSSELVEENRKLRTQVSNLKEVLMESSIEMEKCKEEFIKLKRQKDRFQKLSRTNQDENLKMKALLAEKDLEVRQKNRESFVSTRVSRC